MLALKTGCMGNHSATSTPDKIAPPLDMSEKRRWAVTAGVLLGMFLAALEMTIVGTAMPTIVASLGGLNHFSWVISAYLITSTVTVPVWGKLSDIYGRRLLYQIGIALFLLGSALSGMATSMTQLIAFRALQGLGAGALIPLAMTIIGDIYTLEERARMQAVFSALWGLSSIVGPLVGGFITDQLSWRWVFYINIPFGFAAALVIGLALQEPKRRERPVIDYAGAAVLTTAVTLLMLALMKGEGAGASFTSPRNLALLASAAVLLVVFVGIERRAPDPMVPFELFANRMVAVAVAVSFFVGMAMFGAISFVPLFAQAAMGATATEAGSLLTPLMLSWVTLSVIGGRMLLKVGFRTTAITGLVLLVCGFALLSMSGRDTPRFQLYADLALAGAGLGLTVLTLVLSMQQAVTRSQLGITTSLGQFARSIGGAIGVAVMGAVLSTGLSSHLYEIAHSGTGGLTPQRAAQLAANSSVLIDPAARAELPPAVVEALQIAIAATLQNVFWLCTLFAAIALVIVFWMPHGRDGLSSAPSPESCSAETGERMLMAELTCIDAPHEPVAAGGDGRE